MIQKPKKYLARFASDKQFRDSVALHGTFLLNAGYAVFKFVTGVIYSSVWLAAISFYYVILSMIRFNLLRGMRQNSKDETMLSALKKYRFTGFSLFVMDFAVAIMLFQMIWQNRAFEYPGHIVYAIAFYTFYRVVWAFIDFIKHGNSLDPIQNAAKNVNLSMALVALFVLQTTLLAKFGSERSGFRRGINILSGLVLLLGVFVIAVRMIRFGNKEIKRLRLEEARKEI